MNINLLTYWRGEIDSSIQGVYAHMNDADSDECEQERSAFQEICDLAEKQLKQQGAA